MQGQEPSSKSQCRLALEFATKEVRADEDLRKGQKEKTAQGKKGHT